MMTQAAAMPCPLCQIPLVMSERQGVEIDYCPQCRGVWLDRGELDKILQRAASESAQPAPRPQADFRQQDYPQQGYQQQGYAQPYKKRRKSFLEELFD